MRAFKIGDYLVVKRPPLCFIKGGKGLARVIEIDKKPIDRQDTRVFLLEETTDKFKLFERNKQWFCSFKEERPSKKRKGIFQREKCLKGINGGCHMRIERIGREELCALLL